MVTSDRGQLFVIIELAVMELHQLQMALLVLDDRLLRLPKAEKFFCQVLHYIFHPGCAAI